MTTTCPTAEPITSAATPALHLAHMGEEELELHVRDVRAGTRAAGPHVSPRNLSERHSDMSTFITCDGATLFYRDWGGGQPIVFSHGWPLSADAWDAQMMFFVMRGYRVIAHDRRGHGRSEQTSDHNDMDSYADDLADPGSPHGLAQTQPLEFNADLLAFIEGFGAQRAAPAAAPSGP